MSLFTFILEFNEGTYIKQIESNSAENASRKWAKEIINEPIKELGPAGKKLIIQEMKNRNNDIVPVSYMKNVWSTTFLINGKLALLNIVKTIRS